MQKNERGIAIVLSLFLMSAMSVLAASMMFLSQTETYASMNYRMMSQARYAGEAGIQKASDFLLNSTQYAVPGTVGDPLANYNRAVSPVTFNGQPVVLSAVASQPSNYPAAAVQTAFSAAGQGTLAAGNATLTYGSYATLIAMRQFDAFGGSQAVVQTWEITGVGALAGARPATVEVVAIVETPKVPANNFGAFATDPTCGALYFHGNVLINSYDSRIPGGPAASMEASGGDVGTNGNLHIQGSVEVQGNLYTPRVGVGTCEDGAVTALSAGGNAVVTGSTVQLPNAMAFPPPAFSSIPPTNTVTIDSAGTLASACTSLNLTAGVNCFIDAGAKTLRIDGNGTDVTLPSVSIGNHYTLILDGASTPGQAININSLSGRGDVEINANLLGAGNEAVVLKVAGKNPDGSEMAVPFDLSNMAWKQNSAAASYDSSAFQIIYGGSGTISMEGGNSQSAVTIYAPNADFELQGTQDLYGSVIARTVENHGNANIHYDRRLTVGFYIAGNPMVGSFSWKRF